MKFHKLKIKEEYYDAIRRGVKRFELRKNDREFEVGDLITFQIVDEGSIYSSLLVFQIVYILEGVPEYGLSEGHCILGIELLKSSV